MKILTISDGNGVDRESSPRWPTILRHLTDIKILNKSVVGASNETMFNLLRDTDLSDVDHAVVQWTAFSRLDVIVDDFWITQAENDPVYYFNLHKILGDTWWVSSASQNEHVLEYHKKYIRTAQAKHRSTAFLWAAIAYLNHHGVPFTFSLCYDLDLDLDFPDGMWAWHKPNGGIRSFHEISKHGNLDIPECPRPHPLVQLDWLRQILIPKIGMQLDESRFSKIEKMFIERTKNNLLLQL